MWHSFPDDRVANRVSKKRAVASRIDRADNSKFIEQFRYTIVASQLLSGHSILAQKHLPHRQGDASSAAIQDSSSPTSAGLLLTATLALTLAWVASWVYSEGLSHLAKKRILFTVGLVVVAVVLSHAYIRQQWLRYLREQAMTEITAFVSRSQDFDSASSAAVALVQEVELVSRGYRM